MNKVLCGSTYFFKDLPNFKSKDIDEIILVDKGNGFNYLYQISTGTHCLFYIVRRNKEELIQFDLEYSPGMVLNRYLIPEFCKEFNITISDLIKLKPLVDKLDSKHLYLESIYNSYLENNKFELTKEQLEQSYKIYKHGRLSK